MASPWISHLSLGIAVFSSVNLGRIDHLPDACEVMMVVLRNKVQMIHEPHGLLQARMQPNSAG